MTIVGDAGDVSTSGLAGNVTTGGGEAGGDGGWTGVGGKQFG